MGEFVLIAGCWTSLLWMWFQDLFLTLSVINQTKIYTTKRIWIYPMLYPVFTGWHDIKAYNMHFSICSIKSELNLASCKCWFSVETSLVRMVCHGPLTDSQRKMRVRSVWGLLSSVCVCFCVGVCKGCYRVGLCLQIAPPHKASHNGPQALKLCRCLFFLQQQQAVPGRLCTYPLSPRLSTNISAFLLLFLLYSAYLPGSSSFSLHISQGLPPSHFLCLKQKHTLSDYLQNTFFLSLFSYHSIIVCHSWIYAFQVSWLWKAALQYPKDMIDLSFSTLNSCALTQDEEINPTWGSLCKDSTDSSSFSINGLTDKSYVKCMVSSERGSLLSVEHLGGLRKIFGNRFRELEHWGTYSRAGTPTQGSRQKVHISVNKTGITLWHQWS